MLFAARLDRMIESEIEAVVLARQGDCEWRVFVRGVGESSLSVPVPSLQAPDAQETATAAAALTMIGGMALHKYQSINPRRVDSLLLTSEVDRC